MYVEKPCDMPAGLESRYLYSKQKVLQHQAIFDRRRYFPIWNGQDCLFISRSVQGSCHDDRLFGSFGKGFDTGRVLCEDTAI